MKNSLLSFQLLSIAQNSGANYPFNNYANDISDNGYHATVYGATLTSDRFGNPNTAFSFDLSCLRSGVYFINVRSQD